MYEFIDETSSQEGTQMNRAAMMGVQGFIGNNIQIGGGKITEVNSLGQTTEYSIKANGDIVIKFTGEKTITKTVKFNGSSITEVLS